MNDEKLKEYYDAHYSSLNIIEFLEDLGVPRQHLEYIENQKIQGYAYPRKVFDYLGRADHMLIPLNQIIGSNVEGNIGHDWLDLVRYTFNNQSQTKALNLKPSRLRTCLSYLYDLGWENWNKSYQTKAIGDLYFSSLVTDNGQTIQYMHEGGVGGGRHRFFASKIAGATHIRAKYVDQYRLNQEKVYYYNAYRELEQQIKKAIDQSSIFEKCEVITLKDKDCYSVYLTHTDMNYIQHLGELFYEEYELKKLEDFKRYVTILKILLDNIKAIERLTIQATKHRYQWLSKWYIKTKLDDRLKLHVHSDAFLKKQDDIFEYLKWHMIYDAKIRR